MKCVYGPVPSWRLGSSLGVDPISVEDKICSFNCVYCQLGGKGEMTAERKIFVTAKAFEDDLKHALEKTRPDVITFSGTGEPTLAKNLGEMVDVMRKMTDLPIAVLTNSSLMYLEEVREILSRMDIVVAKLDAPNQELFRKINRPAPEITFDKVVDGITSFRSEFSGKLALQMMFIKDNKDYAEEMAEIAVEIKPDEVQINTPLRPCRVKPLTPEEIESIKNRFDFKGLNIVSVYDAEKPEVKAIDKEEIMRRRRIVEE